jgi:hypothetical protein
MKYIRSYTLYESTLKVFEEYDASNYYKNTGQSAQPGWQDWIYNFFRSMQNRFQGFDRFYQREIAVKKAGGGSIDTGLGWLIGKSGSLATELMAKIFEPNKFASLTNQGLLAPKSTTDVPTIKSSKDVTPEHHRLLNDQFVKNDLPNISNDDQMKDYIFNYYKKIGVPPNYNKVADEVAATYATTYFNNKKSQGMLAQGLPSTF